MDVTSTQDLGPVTQTPGDGISGASFYSGMPESPLSYVVSTGAPKT